jgi:hypothetical protein
MQGKMKHLDIRCTRGTSNLYAYIYGFDKYKIYDVYKINVNLYLQRETEEKARQPETKLSAIAQTRHKAGYATQSKAEPNTPNTHTGRETGLNNLSRGPGETAHWGPASGTRRDVRARPTQGRVAPVKGNAALPERPRCIYIYLLFYVFLFGARAVPLDPVGRIKHVFKQGELAFPMPFPCLYNHAIAWRGINTDKYERRSRTSLQE